MTAESFQQEINRRCLQQHVTYHGEQHGSAKEALLAQADAFLLPTLNDCFPLVLLEAMRHGLPCISTSVGAIPEIIGHGHTGFICPEVNASALCDAMLALMQSPSICKSFGEAGKVKYNTFFTRKKFEENILRIISDTFPVMQEEQ